MITIAYLTLTLSGTVAFTAAALAAAQSGDVLEKQPVDDAAHPVHKMGE